MSSTQPMTKQPAWHDTKKYAWLLGLIIPTLPLLVWPYTESFGAMSWVLWWLGPLLLYVIIPILDVMFGAYTDNPPEDQVSEIESRQYYRWIVWAFVPFQYASFIFAMWYVANHDMAWYNWLGFALTVGAIGGIGINTAHELGHKKPAIERWLSRITLAQTFYGHFYVEHNRGHHKNVATPEDPASSKLGENFWAFLPRTVWGSLKSAWNLEKERLARQQLSVWSWRNENLQSWAMSVVLYSVVLVVFGWKVLPFLLVQMFYGFSLLEVVNYIEHYGLSRQKDANGRYERCRPEHSWNANHTVTNIFLYQLQRHSDHHANPTRRYQTLRHFEEAPQLPAGYAAMITLAMLPPLWFKIMDKKVIEHYKDDLSRANILPKLKHKYLNK